MKKIALLLLAAVMVLPMNAANKEKKDDNTLKVMSYNIRLGSANDGTNSWGLRYPATAEMIEDQMPDIFGVQEALASQIRFIEDNFVDYKSVGVGREDGKKDGETLQFTVIIK